jgi:hypothetical protein
MGRVGQLDGHLGGGHFRAQSAAGGRGSVGLPVPGSLFAAGGCHLGCETREYDTLVVYPAAVLVNETKAKLLAAHVENVIWASIINPATRLLRLRSQAILA